MVSVGRQIPILNPTGRVERAAKRAARDMLRLRSSEQTSDDLTLTDAELHRLTGCHRIPFRPIDWPGAAALPVLETPPRVYPRRDVARKALAAYRPSWRELLFGNQSLRRRELVARVLDATTQDEADNEAARRTVELNNRKQSFAAKVLELETAPVQEALARCSTVDKVADLVNAATLTVLGSGRAKATVEGLMLDDIPDERLSGGMRTAMTTAQRNEVHLASVCSIALRIGLEVLGALRLSKVCVLVQCELVQNGASIGKQTVLEVTLSDSNLPVAEFLRSDPMSLVARLGGRLDWSPQTGFKPIWASAESEPDAALAMAG
ncbi:hypothetical protein [Phenylobacterium deserti]|uniref:Uncharacterized protein n=1 Tax=Phenylobacterium deserti TaxID=1914756 RepID=A0A328ATV2_9CAUL|nr:hypothetical protein [Phenylobacterium deserti]RAK57651.1 hypothetical protein DJ018_06915 [Phenylobacterium deserti]